MYNFFYSLMAFIVSLFFLMIGVMSLAISWSEDVRYTLMNAIDNHAVALSLFGFAFIIVGLAIIIDIVMNSRKSYYRIRSDHQALSIDEEVVQQYITVALKHLFPDRDISNHLKIKNNRFHISIELPHQVPSVQKAVLEQIKEELQIQFASHLGYREDFFLSASFQPSKQLLS